MERRIMHAGSDFPVSGFSLNALLQRKNLEKGGALPDGRQKRNPNQRHPYSVVDSAGTGVSMEAPFFRGIFADGTLWLVFAVHSLKAPEIQGALIHQVAYMEDKGLSGERGPFSSG
jgi:hypothetical protein